MKLEKRMSAKKSEAAFLELIAEAAFLELVAEDTESALQLITGMFVGLTLEYTRRRGEDASKTLRIINGCGNRDITIHELPKAVPGGVTLTGESEQ